MEDANNPYRAPNSRVESLEDMAAVLLRQVSRTRRFLTLLIDYVAITLFSALIMTAAGMIGDGALFNALDQLPDLILGIVIGLLYYAPLEGMFGRTVGKFILGTRVVNEFGGSPTFQQVLLRSLCRFIPFEAFSFLGADARGWHDSIPKTHVVMCR